MLILHPAFQLPPYILQKDKKKGISPNKPLTRPAHGQPISDFILSHTNMTRDPI
jgi:hypothetical protein